MAAKKIIKKKITPKKIARRKAVKKKIQAKTKTKDAKPSPHTHYHKDGSIWAKGKVLDGVPIGYWEWFRKTGTKMRSGYFDEKGQQAGEWTTYDAEGKVYKVTRIKPKK